MGIVETSHERFREWEEACARKDAVIVQLTAERDAALEMNEVLHNQCGVVERAFVKLTAERDALKAQLYEGTQLKLAKALAETRNETIRKLTADNERRRAEYRALEDETGANFTRVACQLTELRQAAEEFLMSINITWDGWNQQRVKVFRAVLAKVTP